MPGERFIYRELAKDERQTYANDGFLRYGPVLTEFGIERMRQECMIAWSAEKEAFDLGKTWLQNALLPDIHLRSEIVRQYLFSGPMVTVVAQLIGPNLKAAANQLTFKMRGNTQAFSWHQDNSYGELDPYNAISCITALDDADRQNGCLWLIPGSHQQGQIPLNHSAKDKRAQLAIELEVDERAAIPMEMKAGECLFFHCHTLHRSEGNLSADRDRRILFTRYADADAVEVYNERRPRLGRLLRGATRFPQVEQYESDLPLR